MHARSGNGMNAVAANGEGSTTIRQGRAAPIDQTDDRAPIILLHGDATMTQRNGIRPKPVANRRHQNAVQIGAMNGDLRPLVARGSSAGLPVYALAKACVKAE